ncbi:MAG: acyl-CoA/acyl-ACP dehydrogenase [Acidimicrobiia bacterium]|nr:acyl-CoA/acyl-ACP dehydrogenase [Acidimicrobiia bacterium]
MGVAKGILTSKRAELVERMAALGPSFAERAEVHDRDATFPAQNWADLRDAGLLGLCIPVADGGLGGDFVGYALVAEELGRHCATTALTFNMHTATTILVGQIADDLDLTADERSLLAERRARLRSGIVADGTIHSQPFSEGVAAGATAGYSTRAVPAPGGYRVTGRKIFASLSGAAHIHNVVCLAPGDERIRFMGVPADAPGASIEGEWDPLGMRGTDSRTLVLNEAVVPAGNEWLPPGAFDQAATRWPYFYMTLSFAYLGLMRGILDATAAYLRGDGGSGPARRDHPIKQQGWAQMNLICDQAQSLTYRVLAECGVDPSPDQVRRAWSSVVTVMEGAPAVASLALQVCGGRSMLRPSYLEQAYRDARCGAAMLPWSVEVCLQRLGRTGLYPEQDEAPACQLLMSTS